MDIDNKIIAFIKQILIILLFMLLNVFLSLLFYQDGLNSFSTSLRMLTSDIIILTIFIFIFRKTLIPDFYDFKKDALKYIKPGFIIWLIGLVIMVVTNKIIGNYIGLAIQEDVNRNILNTYPVYATITMIFIYPIIEELMTRVILKDTFKHYLIYAVISGLIFGLLHVINVITSANILELLYIIPYGTLGFCFALIYHKTSNVWSNIFYHSFHNLIAILILFIGSVL